MKKLLKLEEELKKAKAVLEKQAVNTAPGGFALPEAMKAEDHKDEKEDKQLIAEAIDLHNEKKHGESKNKNSAFKDLKIKKAEETFKFENNGQWSLGKAENEEKPAKPSRAGDFHGEIHEFKTVRGDKLLKYPKKSASGEIEYGYKKVPNKVTVQHKWNSKTNDWEHVGTQSHGAPEHKITTPMDAAREKMNAASKPAENKPAKTVLRKK